MTAIKDLVGAHGVVAYNGVAFNVFRQVEATITPVYDDADRSRRHNLYRFKIEGTVYAADEVTKGNQLLDLRQRLTTPGRTLEISGQGFGDLLVTNGVSGVTPNGDGDVLWGPKPRLLALRPLGGNIVFEVSFEVEVALADCYGAASVLSSATYTTEWQTNDSGMTRRSIAGALTIPQVRDGRRDTADAFWNNFQVYLPLRFRRVSQSRNISADRSRLEFSIVDEEEPSDDALPAGIVRASFPVSLQNNSLGWSDWTLALRGSFEVAPGYPRDWAFRKWMMLAAAQLDHARRGVGRKGAIIPDRFLIGHDKFRRTWDFSLTVRLLAPMSKIFAASGLFEPVPGTNWEQWRTSMSGAWSARGMAGLTENPASDAVFGFCDQLAGVRVIDQEVPPARAGAGTLGLFDCKGVTPAGSWLDYQQFTTSDERHSLAAFRPLNGSFGGVSSRGRTDFEGIAEEAGRFASAGAVGMTLQQTARPMHYVSLTGSAIRVKYKPYFLPLLQWEGSEVREVARSEKVAELGKVANCAVYGMWWSVKYLVVRTSASQSLAPQPTPDTDR